MGKPLIRSAIMLFMVACGPETGDGNEIPGMLEYEQLYNRVYRIDRRIDASFEFPGEDRKRWECGLLTDRAYDDLEGTLATLDPSVDYSEHPTDCNATGPSSTSRASRTARSIVATNAVIQISAGQRSSTA